MGWGTRTGLRLSLIGLMRQDPAAEENMPVSPLVCFSLWAWMWAWMWVWVRVRVVRVRVVRVRVCLRRYPCGFIKQGQAVLALQTSSQPNLRRGAADRRCSTSQHSKAKLGRNGSGRDGSCKVAAASILEGVGSWQIEEETVHGEAGLQYT